ncbi:hypothetical protein ABH940_003579 [Streptacidiphilus sp. BW17]
MPIFVRGPLRCVVMKLFLFQHAQDVWPEGESVLHVYVTPQIEIVSST